MLKHKLLITIIPFFICFTLGSCNLNCVHPSGKIVTEARDLGQISGIDLQCSGKVLLKSGPPAPIRILTDDNLLPMLSTEVDDGILVIDLNQCITGNKTMEIEVYLEDVSQLSVSGSGEIIGMDKFRAETAKLNVSGSGDIVVALSAGNIESHISGSGSITATGKAKDHKIHISGSGHLYARDLYSEVVEVHLSGSGKCQVNAHDLLDVNISGSGSIEYAGTPKIKSNISGSGKLYSVED